MAQVKRTFRPEFLGRIDELIVMNSLTQADGERIAALILGRISQQLARQGVMLEYEDDVLKLLAQEGVDSMSGARNLRRVIAKYVEDPLSDLLLTRSCAGERLMLKISNDEIKIELPQIETVFA